MPGQIWYAPGGQTNQPTSTLCPTLEVSEPCAPKGISTLSTWRKQPARGPAAQLACTCAHLPVAQQPPPLLQEQYTYSCVRQNRAKAACFCSHPVAAPKGTPVVVAISLVKQHRLARLDVLKPLDIRGAVIPPGRVQAQKCSAAGRQAP